MSFWISFCMGQILVAWRAAIASGVVRLSDKDRDTMRQIRELADQLLSDQ